MVSFASTDLAPNRRRLRVVLVVVVLAALGGAGYVAYTAFTGPSKAQLACENVMKLADTDAERTHNLVRLLVMKAKDLWSRNNRRLTISGTTDGERCEQAMDALEELMTHGMYTRFADCMTAAKKPYDGYDCIQ